MHVVVGSHDPTTITTKVLNATWGNLAFNLENDIGETKNLAAEKLDVVKKLETCQRLSFFVVLRVKMSCSRSASGSTA